MDLQHVLAQLQCTPCAEAVAPLWEESMASMPAVLPFLEDDAVRTARSYCSLDEDMEPQLLRTVAAIRGSDALKALAWHAHRRIFDAAEAHHLTGWPLLREILGDDSGAFYMVVGLSMVPLVQAHHAQRGLPAEITRDTCSQIRSFNALYRAANGGRNGIGLGQIYWLHNYVHHPIFRVGRMEYWSRPYYGHITVYMNAAGHTVALAPPDTPFDRDGYILSDDEEGMVWRSAFRADDDTVTGCPIAPAGHVLREEIVLARKEWRRVFGHGDPVLDMHIPGGDPLTPDVCRDSMTRAAAFFRQYLPDAAPAAIVCSSWLYSPLLKGMLKPSSNLLQLQDELYLFPLNSSREAGFLFIFHLEPFDLAAAPRETGLQRSLLAFLEQGGRWRGGGMFILLEDLEHFGTQHYLKTWPGPRVMGDR